VNASCCLRSDAIFRNDNLEDVNPVKHSSVGVSHKVDRLSSSGYNLPLGKLSCYGDVSSAEIQICELHEDEIILQ
jgi:hypothetical protein